MPGDRRRGTPASACCARCWHLPLPCPPADWHTASSDDGLCMDCQNDHLRCLDCCWYCIHGCCCQVLIDTGRISLLRPTTAIRHEVVVEQKTFAQNLTIVTGTDDCRATESWRDSFRVPRVTDSLPDETRVGIIFLYRGESATKEAACLVAERCHRKWPTWCSRKPRLLVCAYTLIHERISYWWREDLPQTEAERWLMWLVSSRPWAVSVLDG